MIDILYIEKLYLDYWIISFWNNKNEGNKFNNNHKAIYYYEEKNNINNINNVFIYREKNKRDR
jgi:hypothetical protein